MQKKEYDKLASRLALTLQRFNNGERLTTKALAEEYNVSVKTIQRDFNERLTALPIECEKGVYFLPTYCLGKLSFDDIKHFAAFSGFKTLYPKLNNDLIVDILNAKTNRTMKIKGQSYEELSHKLTDFNALGGAILSHFKIKFLYSEKSREVKPYMLLNTNGVWYLAAVEKDVLKHFTLSKIRELFVTEEAFSQEDEILHILENEKSVWYSQNPIEVHLQIDQTMAAFFLRRELLPEQKVVEESESHLVLSCKVAFKEEIQRIVRYWIPHVTILTPVAFQNEIEEGLEKYLKKDF